MKKQRSGLGKKERAQLTKLLKANLTVITPQATTDILHITSEQATWLLHILRKKGWLIRLKQGTYLPVTIQDNLPNTVTDEPWKLAQALFEPCYIGGWNAAEYWGFTEQVFNSVMVFSTKKLHSRDINLQDVHFIIKTIKKDRMFGTKHIWQNDKKIAISDPTKTIVDAFNDPSVVGGIRMAIEILDNYLKSTHKNLELLYEYGIRMKNSALFKRIGFVFMQEHFEEKQFIEKLRTQIKSGYSQLDPASPSKNIMSEWNLWVPKNFKSGVKK